MSSPSDPRLVAINPPVLGKPRGYANGILAPAGGRLLFVAGQIAWDEQQQIVSDDFRDQFAQALANVATVVREAGGEPADVAQLTLFVTDRREYLACTRELGDSYRLVMGSHYPAMALVEVSALLEPRAKVEIQGIAVLQPRREAVNETTGDADVADFSKALAEHGGTPA